MTDTGNVHESGRRRVLKMLSVAAGTTTLAGCTGGDDESGDGGAESSSSDGSSGGSSSGKHGGSMTFALGGSPTNLSYWQSYDTVTNNLTTQIWDSLLEYSEPDMELQPALAESWEAPDDTTYVYELREGVTFHDGSEMTADDVIASANLTLRDEAKSPLAWMFGAVDNFEKVDDYTVQVNMSEVDASFKYVPATTAWSVAPKSAIEEMGTDLAQDPIGAGPFQLEEWQSGNYVRISRHDDYWDGDLPYLDEAMFQVVPNGTSRITGMQNGEFGGTNDIPIDQLSVLDQIDDVELHTATSFQTSHLAFNCMEGPFSNVEVRRATSYAVDTQAITESTVGEYGSHATSMLPEGMMGHVTPDDLEYDGFPYDPEAARQLLDDAGFTGSPRFEATLMTPQDTVRQKPAVAIQQYLSEVGIDVSVDKVSYSTYVDTIWGEEDFSARPDMQMTLWASDYPSPDAIIRPLFDSEQLPPSNNWFGYQNEEVDQLLQQFKTTLDTEQRAQYAKQANQMVVDEAPGIWVFHPDTTKAFNTKFEGYNGQVPAFVTYFTTFLRDMYISE
ncbi:ABC transporter substrate-binding protein [Haloplanus ruber]|uniref:ABC transporter substrate-binding protein n=1 Tax=Haloplanus ruber TaxID=869892 RepID=A0ABD6CZK4_9EURY|nr:ABC transporter substrate-binding protein [Haloplanus ruber]